MSVRELTIKTGVVKRIGKELNAYQKELVTQTGKHFTYSRKVH